MSENYWSLVIEPGFSQAGIWKIDESKILILSLGESKLWKEEDFLEVTDAALSDAIARFPEDESEPSKTVFGVPPSWVAEGQIKPEHLGKIRESCAKLSLTPTGFVVIPEAIAHSIKIQEGSPLTGVIIGVGNKLIDITVFKLGNLVGTISVGRTASVASDIAEGLARFASGEPIPTRIMLYDGDAKKLDEVKQELVALDWEDAADGKLKFLHKPQVEVVSPENKLAAVSIAGASEIGEVTQVEYPKDSKVTEEREASQEDENVRESEDLSPEEIGFVIDEDIGQAGLPAEGGDKLSKQGKGFKFKMPKFKLPLFAKRRGDGLKTVSHSGEVNRKKRIAIILTILLVAGLAATGAAWWYLPKATVVIYVSPKTLEETEALTLDESIESEDRENLIFPAERLTVEISGEKTRQTTGTRTVGDKAKGAVTIRNGTSSGESFASGTVLVGPNELKFSLSESASVSAALSPSEPGTVTVNAEASDIGAEYNLASGESMSVGNYPKSEVDAVVETEFSGGSSQEVVAVSQNDLDTLEEELTEELKRKGLSELEGKARDMRFVPDSVEIDVISESFNAGLGDEAASVTLSLKIEVTGIAISNSTIENLANIILADQVPEGFNLRQEQIDVTFDLVSDLGEGAYDFDVELIANLLPETDIDEIRKNIAGKYPPQAEKYLSTIPGYNSAEVRINPRFPGRLGVIPRIEKNIQIEIAAER